MTELMTASQFKWFLTLVTGIVAGAWIFYDGINLMRLRGKDPKDPVYADKRFGFVVGIVIGVIGVVGALRFNGVV